MVTAILVGLSLGIIAGIGIGCVRTLYFDTETKAHREADLAHRTTIDEIRARIARAYP